MRVAYVTEDGTARGTDFGLAANGATACSADFVRGRGALEFAAGTAELVQLIEVATCVDQAVEGPEVFALRLTELINAYGATQRNRRQRNDFRWRSFNQMRS